MIQKMGAFLAQLRKEQGLTQQQLAEKIGVSNKSVSRWENGESAPDLSLLPVLAELYHISTDELLSGGRKAAKKPGACGEEVSDTGAEKNGNFASKAASAQLCYLLGQTKNKSFRSLVLAATLLLVGLVGALSISYGARMSVLGVGVGVMLALSAACRLLMTASALCEGLGDQKEDTEYSLKVRACRYLVCRQAAAGICAAFCVALVLLPGLFPLLAGVTDSTAVLTAKDWAKFGFFFLGLGLCICAAGLSAFSKKLWPTAQAGRAKKCGLAVVCTGVVLLCGIWAAEPYFRDNATVYTDWTSFCKAMEVPSDNLQGQVIWGVDETGKTVSKTVYGKMESYQSKSGKKYYRWADENVVSVVFSDTLDGTPIYTYTEEQLKEKDSRAMLLTGWPTAMVFLFGAGFWCAAKKRTQRIQ